jgi:hypothetical protein
VPRGRKDHYKGGEHGEFIAGIILEDLLAALRGVLENEDSEFVTAIISGSY